MEVLWSRPRHKEIGVGLDDGGQIVFAVADVDVLIDGDVGEETEADLVAGGHHDGIVVGVGGAPHHVGALDGGSGRASADGAAAVELGQDLFESEGVEVGISEAPMAAALKPNAGGGFKRGNEIGGVGDGAVGGVDDGAVDLSEGALGAGAVLGLEGSLVGWLGDGGGGDDDDVGVFAAGHLDEALEVGCLGGAAGDEEISLLGTVRGWLGYGDGCQGCDDHPNYSREA
jgi:hypothetical protein